MNNTFRILSGHWLEVAKRIRDNSIQCFVTSPPYWGYRNYGTDPQVWDGDPAHRHRWRTIEQIKSWNVRNRDIRDRQQFGKDLADVRERTLASDVCKCGAWRGELGQELSPADYIRHLVQCFAEVWRVLRPDGVLLVNLDDAYYNYRPGNHDDARAQGFNRDGDGNARDLPSFTPKRGLRIEGLKEKDLIGLPWMLAFALRDFGWYWRSRITWYKPNPLPESVRDRPTRTDEPILMFTKSQRYFWDAYAIAEAQTGNAHPQGRVTRREATAEAGNRANSSFSQATSGITDIPGGRNSRTVWEIQVQGYPDDHFASFPEELAARGIKAASSEVGCCEKCGAPWRRILLTPAPRLGRHEKIEHRWRRAADERDLDLDGELTIGWQRGCRCYAGRPVPCKVGDLFGGRGTVGSVAVRFGRNAIIGELKPEYVSMIRRNIAGEQPLWVREEVEATEDVVGAPADSSMVSIGNVIASVPPTSPRARKRKARPRARAATPANPTS